MSLPVSGRRRGGGEFLSVGGLCQGPGSFCQERDLCQEGVSVRREFLSGGEVSLRRGLSVGGLCPEGGLCLEGGSLSGGGSMSGEESLSDRGLCQERVSVRRGDFCQDP